ncbi:mechanosensitive ion channel family protein [Tenacibaculum jejuense]|uniref:Mechanosensitive ion channel family protein n=1 Tax=Tenacibaculum jejuense TaxID=584609 RepID=A0A238U5M8_9FLAO|nr:mechanosensitive ion channel family protein [Tenacibaculum jejuense]SNR13918.1 Mechanosensitive ion channel family protein [Tenacibaculum jejuense]
MNLNNTLQKVQSALITYWNEFLAHVPGILIAILIVIIGFLLSNLISSIFQTTISKRTKDPLITNFLGKTVKYGLIVLAIIFALNIAGLGYVATGFITAAGASAVIIGFAFKDIGENFISGVILSFNRPFDVNDTVLIGDIFGKVKMIEFRHSKLKTFDGRDVYIPNSDIIKKPVFNYTEDGYYRIDFTVGIDYNDDVELAKKVIIKSVVDTPGVIDTSEHKCFVVVDSLGTSTVNLKVLFWTKTMEYKRGASEIKSDVVKNVKNVIMNNGLNMPSDITEVKLYNSQKEIPISVN